jgi:hypothetical protein
MTIKRDIPAVKTIEELLRRYDLGSIETLHKNPMFAGQEIGNGADLNDYTFPGFYYCELNVTAATIANTPVDWAFSLAVEHHAENGACKQTFSTYSTYQNSTSRVYRRNYYNGTWGAWSWLVENKDLLDLMYPVGSIYLSVNTTNPSVLFGGTWISFGEGRMLAGVNTSDSDFNTVEKSGGSKDLQSHSHSLSSGSVSTKSLTGSFLNVAVQSSATDISATGVMTERNADGEVVGYATSSKSGNGTTYTDGFTLNASHNHTLSGNTSSTGAGSAGNLPPYITVYMWKRRS